MNLDIKNFLRAIFRSKKALATVLYVYLDGERTAEMPIFDIGKRVFRDPVLLDMLEQHRADEVKHIRMYEECIAQLTEETGELGDLSGLSVVSEFHQASGRLLDGPDKALECGGVGLDRAIMEAFLYIYALELRAVENIQSLLPAAREAGERDITEMFEVILADEKVHLSYCNVIAKRFAPSIEFLRARKEELIALENETHRRQTWLIIHHLYFQGLLKGMNLAGPSA